MMDPHSVDMVMPPLQKRRHVTSFFEFWPSWIIYIPVVLQWIALSIRYRSLSLPLIANPTIPLAGMVGESKSEILNLAGESVRPWIAPWVVYQKDDEDTIESQVSRVLQALAQAGIALPIVAKPDQGCRGAGVWKIESVDRLREYLIAFPQGGKIILQRLSRFHPEAGIFYVREPHRSKGRVISITLKHPPVVIGDGSRSLRELILDDERASKLTHIYFPRFEDRLDVAVPLDERVQLVFAGNHCRGSLFRDGNEHITPALEEALDHLLKDVDQFYFGRLDVRFRDLASLKRGEDFEIIEINGAASEATHIWDPDTSIFEVYRALFEQYKLLFTIGDQVRSTGVSPPGVRRLLQAWRDDRKLTLLYPPTD